MTPLSVFVLLQKEKKCYASAFFLFNETVETYRLVIASRRIGGVAISKGNFILSDYQRTFGTLNNNEYFLGRHVSFKASILHRFPLRLPRASPSQ